MIGAVIMSDSNGTKTILIERGITFETTYQLLKVNKRPEGLAIQIHYRY
jgi:hypothetical protein